MNMMTKVLSLSLIIVCSAQLCALEEMAAEGATQVSRGIVTKVVDGVKNICPCEQMSSFWSKLSSKLSKENLVEVGKQALEFTKSHRVASAVVLTAAVCGIFGLQMRKVQCRNKVS